MLKVPFDLNIPLALMMAIRPLLVAVAVFWSSMRFSLLLAGSSTRRHVPRISERRQSYSQRGYTGSSSGRATDEMTARFDLTSAEADVDAAAAGAGAAMFLRRRKGNKSLRKKKSKPQKREKCIFIFYFAALEVEADAEAEAEAEAGEVVCAWFRTVMRRGPSNGRAVF